MGMETYSLYSFSNNYLLLFAIYYGILGSLLFASGFLWMIAGLGSRNRAFVLAGIVMFSVTMGAFVNVRTWSYVFIVVLMEKLHREQNREEPPPAVL